MIGCSVRSLLRHESVCPAGFMIHLPRKMNPLDGAAVVISDDTRFCTFQVGSANVVRPEVGQGWKSPAVETGFLRGRNNTISEGLEGGEEDYLHLSGRRVHYGRVIANFCNILSVVMLFSLCVLGFVLFQGGRVVQATPSQPSYYKGGHTPTVKVTNGTLVGRYSSEYNQDFFLGVPFAQPPVGELRFRIPQSINTSYDGHYDASQYSTEVGFASYPRSYCRLLTILS